MKRKQKHYTTEQSILDKIDERRGEANRLNAFAEELESKSKSLLNEYNEKFSDIPWGDLSDDERNLKSVGMECKENALRARKTAKRIEEIILPKLGEVLAEFRTAPMMSITGDDISVASTV